MYWPCREIGPNGEQCALEAGHDGQHIPVTPPPVTPPPAIPSAAGGPPAPPPPAAPGTSPTGAAPPPPAYVAPQPVAPTVTAAPWGGQPRRAGRAPRIIIATTLAALVVAGIGAFAVMQADPSDPGDPATSPAASQPAIVVPGGSTPGSSPIGIVPSPSPTTSVRPLGLPGASGAPAQTTAPLATTTPAPVTSPPASAPAATTGPTPKPLGFGTLSYSSAACFEVDWKDAKGRQISGAEARYAITIKNPTGARTRNIWIGIQTTDQFTTDPLVSRTSWSKRPTAFGNETSLIIAGPRLDKGPTRLKWRAFYQTPIDVHTKIWIAQGPSPAKGSMSLEEIQAGSAFVWEVKTDVRVCY
jgi:hypothetical protein